jgi:hypothetical protein
MTNAFTSVRPRGVDTAPVKAPRKTNSSRAPQQGNVHLLLDRKGRATVSLAPRKSGIVIEGREKGAESIERRKRIKGASQ